MRIDSKTKDQLLKEFRDKKENPIFLMLRMPILIVVMVLVDSHFGNMDSKVLALFLTVLFYVTIEASLYTSRMKKKLDILFEIVQGNGYDSPTDSK